ncbi:MAG: acVLRF1 family peptidyl-tRNA hydrolase, partial [Actinomycetes bacterium]
LQRLTGALRVMDSPHRVVLVAYERLDGWCERFGRRHGDYRRDTAGGSVRLVAPDGAVAEFDDAAPPDRFGLILVRRGGYAIGLAVGGRLDASKCGTRYVQGKTKAGGWSQQRYARRRANQASDLAGAAGEAIRRVLGDVGPLPTYGGGDRRLVEASVEASRVDTVALAERWLDVPDPRYAVLVDAVEQARSVSIGLNALA